MINRLQNKYQLLSRHCSTTNSPKATHGMQHQTAAITTSDLDVEHCALCQGINLHQKHYY